MKTVAEAGAWWIALVGLYILTLSSPSVPELVAAACIAAAGAVAARAARLAMGDVWRPRAGWARWLVTVPWAALRESVTALVTVFREPAAGHVETLTLPCEPRARGAARQAVATVAIGCTPGTMVIAAPAGELLVHRLTEGAAPVLDRVRR
ncbi:Na+/H+ antiporter subunit E [Amycolatopsis sp.]|uniref:Na+/H+ antiporter subunit E n=1 Tax=Amycolatopsis sp. TaxID=37632 RepID=UPI002C8933C2|nr:Na+/H+ antiporter subunit E [Amycolatopsis sp.]HVV14556.1 Na+/H+ antiporter subunit E [Amycolatopsis sp.]